MHQQHCSRLLCVSALLAAWMGLPACAQNPAVGGSYPPPISAQAARNLTVRVPGGVTPLADIGLYRVTYHYFDGRSGEMPIGWVGHFDDRTGISCTPFGSQGGKQAFLIHPIWRGGGTGDTDQIFTLALPHARRIALRFSIAMQDGAVAPAKSDGATFRVFLNDRTLLDQNKADSAWTNETYDLTPYAGQTIQLRFETDPGPKHDSSFDFALWGDRQIDVEGASVAPLPAASLKDYPIQGTVSAWGGASPRYAPGSGARIHTRVAADPRGFLDGWSFVAPGGASWPAANGTYVDLVAADGRVVRSDSPDVHTSVQDRRQGDTTLRTIRYQVGGRTITVTAALHDAIGGIAKVDVRSDDPYIAAVHFGSVGPTAFRRQVIVPYLGQVSYLPDSGLFTNTIIDYTLSDASDLQGDTANYGALTDGRRNPVRETAYVALSPDLRATLPTPPNPPSPYRKLLGDRMILDVWGGRFDDNAAWLRELASYGLTHIDTIVHDWQNGGYDNKLPNVLPANPRYGGDAGMKEWASTAVGLGETFGVHENYVDFYPNAAVYTEKDVAHDSNNHLIPAWKNLIQSYAVAPTAILKYAKMFTPDVHARYGTNGSYLDVHSAVPPWFHVDFRADVPGAGKFHTVWEAHRDLWKLFRQVHGGPVLGEGSNHWYWSGLLDGVEAQFGQGVPGNGGETAPLFVDFDLTRIHPLQFNHGMGYLERWTTAGYNGNWTSRILPMKTLDQYRMQEIAYGHAGFVAAPLVRSLPFVWQEHNLVLPVTRQYATASPVSIGYEVNGKIVPTGTAVALGSAYDRVRVTYDSGVTVWANSRDSDWVIPAAGHAPAITLPQYGWAAVSPDLLAYTGLRDGVVVDYAETPQSLFANARTTVTEPEKPYDVVPKVAQFTQDGPRKFQIAFSWDVKTPLPAGHAVFVHVTGPGGAAGEDIVFQFGSGIAAPPSQWPVGQVTTGEPVSVTLPEGVQDGTYQIRTGIYSPTGGDRLWLGGRDDGSHRIILGTLTVSNGGQKIQFTPTPGVESNVAAERALRLAHTNVERRLIDFGKIATDGSVQMNRNGRGDWTLIPFPRTEAFTVELSPTRLDPALTAIRVTALDAAGKSLGQVPVSSLLTSAAGWVRFRVNTIPGAVRYRLLGGR